MLALAGIHQLTDQSIHALANNCPYLDEIHLSGCALITKQALTFLSVRAMKCLLKYSCTVG